MNISDFLSPENSTVGVRASDKTVLLKELCARVAAAVGLEPGVVLNAILKREELGSTGVGGGIAIPHARIEGVQKPFGMFARLAKPIDYSAVDDRPVDVVFMLLLPDKPAGDQLNALAGVARRLRNPAIVARIRKAPNGRSVAGAPRGLDKIDPIAPAPNVILAKILTKASRASGPSAPIEQ
jgi:PTS system nitrogen regulatory IIA component